MEIERERTMEGGKDRGVWAWATPPTSLSHFLCISTALDLSLSLSCSLFVYKCICMYMDIEIKRGRQRDKETEIGRWLHRLRYRGIERWRNRRERERDEHR